MSGLSQRSESLREETKKKKLNFFYMRGTFAQAQSEGSRSYRPRFGLDFSQVKMLIRSFFKFRNKWSERTDTAHNSSQTASFCLDLVCNNVHLQPLKSLLKGFVGLLALLASTRKHIFGHLRARSLNLHDLKLSL